MRTYDRNGFTLVELLVVIAIIDTGAEQIETDEMVAVSSAQYAGEDSPLTYTAEPGADTRFDIDVPTK